MHRLKCPSCGMEIEHPHESAVCTQCGDIMKEVRRGRPRKPFNENKDNPEVF